MHCLGVWNFVLVVIQSVDSAYVIQVYVVPTLKLSKTCRRLIRLMPLDTYKKHWSCIPRDHPTQLARFSVYDIMKA